MPLFSAYGGFLPMTSSADLVAQILDHQKIILLCVNYMLFSIMVTLFLLFLTCLSQVSAFALDMCSSLGFLVMCFVMMNIILANYVVHSINVNADVKIQYI